MPRFKLLPTTMLAALLFMGVKLIDVVRGTEALSDQLFITNVQAESNSDGHSDAAKEVKKEMAAAEGEAAEAPPAAAEDGEGDDEEKAPSNISDTPGETIDDHLSAVQIELLQKLADRRDELDRWEKDIQLKENVLNAAEKRIDEKIAQIDALKSEVGAMLAMYNEKEDAKIRSLVKIYENMKPKDAARIFDEVEMPVLLIVIDKMAEKKVAPILAYMDPKKAKQLTVEFAEQRKVDEAKMQGVMSRDAMQKPVSR